MPAGDADPPGGGATAERPSRAEGAPALRPHNSETRSSYFLNWKLAWWAVPSLSMTTSWRHAFAHVLSVFQT
jgi:hypothetical protein